MTDKKKLEERSGRVKAFLSGRAVALVVAGIAAGMALGISLGTRADAQAPGDPYSNDLREAAAVDAAPRVTLDGRGRAVFTRPLEVPPLYAFDAPLDDNGRQIILVDSATKRICVYWIRPRGANSTIELVATRNFEYDLKLMDFNGEGLAPSQIREQLEAAQQPL